jgi:hypothetical protein
MKQIIGDGPVQVVSRNEPSRNPKSTKKIKTKIIRCLECSTDLVVPAKPSVLSKALQAACMACQKVTASIRVSEAIEARQKRFSEALEKKTLKEQRNQEAFDRLCKYCGVQWQSDRRLRGINAGHGSVCSDCRKVSTSRKTRAKFYGITVDEVEALFPEGKTLCMNPGCQKEVAEIAPTRGQQGVIDHCHKTGSVRGVLCTQCNMALGLLGESPGRILGLFVYQQGE